MISFLTNLVPIHVRILGILAIIFAVSGYIYVLDKQLSAKEKMLSEANATIATQKMEYEASLKVLEQSINKQNVAVEEWKKRAESAQDRADAYAEIAGKVRTATEKQVFDILNKLPPKTCKESIDALVDAANTTLVWSKPE